MYSNWLLQYMQGDRGNTFQSHILKIPKIGNEIPISLKLSPWHLGIGIFPLHLVMQLTWWKVHSLYSLELAELELELT